MDQVGLAEKRFVRWLKSFGVLGLIVMLSLFTPDPEGPQDTAGLACLSQVEEFHCDPATAQRAQDGKGLKECGPSLVVAVTLLLERVQRCGGSCSGPGAPAALWTGAGAWELVGGRVRPHGTCRSPAQRSSVCAPSPCGVPGPEGRWGVRRGSASDQLGAHAAWGFPPLSEHSLLRLGSTA